VSRTLERVARWIAIASLALAACGGEISTGTDAAVLDGDRDHIEVDEADANGSSEDEGIDGTPRCDPTACNWPSPEFVDS
jgi:hypothetical protein